MAFKKIFLAIVFIELLAIKLNCHAQISPGQTLQINTHFQSILGKPEWVLIVRDTESQRVFPYLFDLKQNNNAWVAFTNARFYQVTVSKLKWGPYASINNFCHLENRLIRGQSMSISLHGELSPNPNDFKCSVMRYNNMPLPFTSQQK